MYRPLLICCLFIASSVHIYAQQTVHIISLRLTPAEKLLKKYYQLKFKYDKDHALSDELLYKALEKADERKTRTLLEAGANINEYDRYGDFPLILISSFATKYPQKKDAYIRIFKFLLSLPGINLDLALEKTHYTSLMACICDEQSEMAQLLLEAGACWSLQDSKQRKATEMWFCFGKPIIMQYIHTIKSLIVKDIEHHIEKTDPARTQVAQPLSQIIVEYL